MEIPSKIKHLIPDARNNLALAYMQNAVTNPSFGRMLRGRGFVEGIGILTDEGKHAARWLLNNDDNVREVYFSTELFSRRNLRSTQVL